jgi:hypothetical protein
MNGELSRASKSYFDVDDDDALGAERSTEWVVGVPALFGLTDDVALRATVRVTAYCLYGRESSGRVEAKR